MTAGRRGVGGINSRSACTGALQQMDLPALHGLPRSASARQITQVMAFGVVHPWRHVYDPGIQGSGPSAIPVWLHVSPRPGGDILADASPGAASLLSDLTAPAREEKGKRPVSVPAYLFGVLVADFLRCRNLHFFSLDTSASCLLLLAYIPVVPEPAQRSTIQIRPSQYLARRGCLLYVPACRIGGVRTS